MFDCASSCLIVKARTFAYDFNSALLARLAKLRLLGSRMRRGLAICTFVLPSTVQCTTLLYSWQIDRVSAISPLRKASLLSYRLSTRRRLQVHTNSRIPTYLINVYLSLPVSSGPALISFCILLPWRFSCSVLKFSTLLPSLSTKAALYRSSHIALKMGKENQSPESVATCFLLGSLLSCFLMGIVG